MRALEIKRWTLFCFVKVEHFSILGFTISYSFPQQPNVTEIVTDLVDLLFEDEHNVKEENEVAVVDLHNPYAGYRNYSYESWLKARHSNETTLF